MCSWQTSQLSFWIIFLRTRLSLVGKEFLVALQTKFFTLLSTGRFQLACHNDFNLETSNWPGCAFWCSRCRNWYPDLTSSVISRLSLVGVTHSVITPSKSNRLSNGNRYRSFPLNLFVFLTASLLETRIAGWVSLFFVDSKPNLKKVIFLDPFFIIPTFFFFVSFKRKPNCLKPFSIVNIYVYLW